MYNFLLHELLCTNILNSDGLIIGLVIRNTVQLTFKFTTCVVFSCVLFKILVKTRVTHVSQQISREGLVHASLDRVWEIFTCLITRNTNQDLRSAGLHRK